MKKAVIRLGLTGWVTIGAAGCGTMIYPGQPAKTETTTADQQSVLDSAEALAQYSVGLIESMAGRDENAIRHYQEAIARDPDNIALKMELAVALLQQGRFVEMDAMVDQVIAQSPRTVRAYQLKALGYRLRGLLREALVPLATAIQLEPKEAIHYLEEASIHTRLEELPEAISILEKALGKVNDRLAIFQALGELYGRQANALLKQHRQAELPETPLELLGRGVEEFPNDPQLLSLYGDLLILHQRIEDAINIFARIEELDPTDLAVRQKLAMSLVATGNRRRAIELLEGIAAERPRQHRLWYYLGELYELEGDEDKAIASYRKAIDVRPDLPESYLKLAFIYLQKETYDAASDILTQGAAKNPDDARFHEMLAYTQLMSRNYDQALTLFAQAEAKMREQQRRPLLNKFYLNYAITEQMAGHLQETAEKLKTGFERDPEIFSDFMAAALRDRGDTNRMNSTLKVLVDLDQLIPRDADTRMLYGMLAFDAADYPTALAQLKIAEEIAIEEETEEDLTAQFYFWLGAASERIKEYEDAETYFLEAIRRQPDHADAHNYLAYMHAERGVKLDMAYDHVGVALAVEPDNPAYLDTRGWIYYHQGKYKEALADILAAAEKIPDDATVTEHLGDVYLALGQEGDAITWWKKALAADPKNETLREKLLARGIELEPTPPPSNPDPDADADAESVQ